MHSLTIAWQMIKRTLGRKKGWISFVIIPCVVVTAAVALLGNEETTSVTIPYMNSDTGPAGKHLIEELSRTKEYIMKPISSEEELKQSIIRQKGKIGIMIPENFSEALLAGDTPTVELYELSSSEASFMVNTTVNGAIGRMGDAATIIRNDADKNQDPKDALENILNQTEKHQVEAVSTDMGLYAKPGLNNVTGFTLMFMMGLISSAVMLIVEDRRMRTMSRIFTAPVRSYQIALGNFLGSFALGALQVLFVLILTKYVLGYEYGIPFFMHFLILTAFMLVAMGIASTVAGTIRNPQNAGMLNSLIITPTCMLGGCFWPLSIMPDFLKKIANFIPQKWAIEAVETAASGGTLADIQLPLLILGLMAVILLGIGSVILRPSETSVNA
ncbi:ABC transporter permease [Paenibacillus sp. N3/727]|uniref:ABC transporter permease n=1 Tax=Paenibacillus sp. N3/727 TaxID=2925845 RepID=UPI001F53B405|nr:ABC transporter permease [Paenibacillus sp. N3/727]UNK18036.1 ABC transporter permease [Paenibacillus sp. N3/727]